MDSCEEKWANIVKSDDDDDESLTDVNNSAICLKEIAPEEAHLLRPNYIGKSRKKAKYFVSDACTTLSFEELKYQLIDTSDTINKKRIPESLKKNCKALEKFDLLAKTPERKLAPQLTSYFSKNLKTSKLKFDSYQLKFDEIEKEVDRRIYIRKHGNDANTAHKKLKTSQLPNIKDELDEPALEPLNVDLIPSFQSSKSQAKLTVLESIDGDFKPTITPATKSYTRKKPS